MPLTALWRALRRWRSRARGAPNYDNGQSDEEAVFVYYGSPAGPSLTPSWTADISVASANLGRAVSTAGDVNGDGYDDIIVGAPGYGGHGMAFGLYGGPDGLGANGQIGNQDWAASTLQSAAYLGYALAAAGDVNGGGYIIP